MLKGPNIARSIKTAGNRIGVIFNDLDSVVLWTFKAGRKSFEIPQPHQAMIDLPGPEAPVDSQVILFHPILDEVIFIVAQSQDPGTTRPLGLVVYKFIAGRYAGEFPFVGPDPCCHHGICAVWNYDVRPTSQYGRYVVRQVRANCLSELSSFRGGTRTIHLTCFDVLDAAFTTHCYDVAGPHDPFRCYERRDIDWCDWWKGQMTSWGLTYDRRDSEGVSVVDLPIFVSGEASGDFTRDREIPMYGWEETATGGASAIMRRKRVSVEEYVEKRQKAHIAADDRRPPTREPLFAPDTNYGLILGGVDASSDVWEFQAHSRPMLWSDDDYIVLKHNEHVIIWSFYTDLAEHPTGARTATVEDLTLEQE